MIHFETAQRALDNALTDLRILSGDIVGPSDATHHDVVGTALVNLGCVVRYLKQAESCKVFPEVRLDS